MNRRNFIGGLAALAAAPLILPEEPTFWQLDRTMLIPTAPEPMVYQKILPPGWVVVRRDGQLGPYEEYLVFKPGTPAAFTLKVDVAAFTSPFTNRRIAENIMDGIGNQEYLLQSIGTAGPPETTLPGYAQSDAYNRPMPEVSLDPTDWPEWWR